MRFFKGNDAAKSEEDLIRDARLTAIASRLRVRENLEQQNSDPLEIRKVLQ